MIINNWKIYYSFIILLIFLPVCAFSQITKIMGKVVDSETKEPLPFVNVYFKGTTIGATTDFNGEYHIETKNALDSVYASYLGYKAAASKVVKYKFQVVDFELKADKINLKEVVIKYKGNPAEVILKKIIEHKEYNNRNRFDAYQFEAYTKIEIDLNNFSEKFKNKKLFKKFDFVFDYVDTSTINGKAYLPFFLSETLSDRYFRKSPKADREIIKASKVSGIDNESILQFLGDLIQNVNVYDNYITIFQKNFISPVANFGLAYYRYYLVDSTFIGDKWCYQLMFKPRRKQELTFTGEFWVHDTSFALTTINMRVNDDANINFINDLVIEQEFSRIDGEHWIISKDRMIGDFNIFVNSRETLGFFGTKTSAYKDFVFNHPKEDKFYTTPTNIIVEEGAFEHSDDYWERQRHEDLSKDEKIIYHMIDTLKTIPAFNTYKEIIKMITTGYYVTGKFEIGPYMSMYSFNSLEGSRFRIGGRTSNDFSTKIMLEAHVAYGVRDAIFKYGCGLTYMFDKNPRRAFGISYKYDIEQLGQSLNAFREDFFLASIFRRNPADKLSMVKQLKTYYEYEWFNGFSNTINFINRNVIAVGSEKFIIPADDGSLQEKENILTSELRLDTRIAYRERILMGEFERISLGADFPIFELQAAYGIPGLFGGEYEYWRLQLSISDWFNVWSVGWSKYVIEVGRTWGRLPYPLLKIHEGNETYYFDEYAFNMMNYYEFVSDKYISVYYSHHFVGLFLNRIPLLRKLKWREVAFIKGVVGGLDEENKDIALIPGKVFELTKPYFEGGVGVENIFRFLRIDGIWRLSYLDHPDINIFGVRATLHFDF
ncbi:MAG: DUF5686 and carboxypeptidase regulatory-like domain-containing protein [Bacteroidales bacterium]|nr:DUF5686 and carboxypeptidase regulatory-like domain-containing protein [Bacteroidales bacterium]